MDQTPVPFGDDVGLDVLAALRELGDGLSKLSDIESISKTGQPASSSKQFDILQSVNRSIAISRWSNHQQELQQSQTIESPSPLPTMSCSPSSPHNAKKRNVRLEKRNSFIPDDTSVSVVDCSFSKSNDDRGDTSDFEAVLLNGSEDQYMSSDINENEEIDPNREVDLSLNGFKDSDNDLADRLEERLDVSNGVKEEEEEEDREEDDEEEEDEDGEEEEEEGEEEEEEDNAVNEEYDEEDEWEDDDDLGFVMLKITEDEFFEMEEEANYRQQLLRASPKQVDLDDGSPLQGHLNLEDSEHDDDSQSNDRAFDHVTSQRGDRRGANLSDMSTHCELLDNEGPPSPPPPEDDEGQGDEREETESHEDSIDSLDGDEQEDDMAAVERAMGIEHQSSQDHDELDDEAHSLSDLPNIEIDSVKSYPLPTSPPSQEAPILGRGHMSRRVSEIMGQKKIRGVDGEHCYFDLKVIFDPYRTGFEEDKNFNPSPGTIIAGRYEMMEVLGQAAFSTALQCVDLTAVEDEDDNERSQWVCLKVIKNSKDFFDQSLDEIKLLQYINSKGNPHEHNVLQMIDYFYCKEHLFIVSELLRENLYEFQKYIRESGGVEYFTPNRLKRIMKQILEALVYIHNLNLLHCDIKPENIVIKSYSRCDVKLIDFGSSCFVTDHLTSYIQSRSYRAPEVILGMEYNYGIDIWSLGGVLAEMHTAYVLFQNDSIASMLCRIEGILGPYPEYMVETGPEAPKYFNMSGIIYERDEEDGLISLIYPKKTSLRARLHLPPAGVASEDEENFLDFVNLMLQVDPRKRPSAAEALNHPWLEGASELDVAYNIEDANPPLPMDDLEDEEEGEYENEDVDDEDRIAQYEDNREGSYDASE